MALSVAFGCQADDGAPRDAGAHADAGGDAAADHDAAMQLDAGSGDASSSPDASAQPVPPEFRAHLDGRWVVLEPVSDKHLLVDTCQPVLLEKRFNNSWQPKRDERPQTSGQAYYLDGKFVTKKNEACDESDCAAWGGVRARAEEFVQTGTKRPPAGEPNPDTPVLVVETRPLAGPLRVTAHYYVEGSDRCGGEAQVASAELIIPIDGVCCPIGPAQCTSPGPSGGWAESYDKCPGFDIQSDVAFVMMADAHGCPVLVADETLCCGDCTDADAGSAVSGTD